MSKKDENFEVKIDFSSIKFYDKNTGDYIGTYASFNECARQLNIHNNHICLFFKGKCKSVGGYTFKRK
jgi:hypothetical protein